MILIKYLLFIKKVPKEFKTMTLTKAYNLKEKPYELTKLIIRRQIQFDHSSKLEIIIDSLKEIK